MEPPYPRPRVVVSRCLGFDPVRYDGSLIPSPLVASLGAHADLVPVCPEVEIGLGVPRATVRIVREEGTDRLVQPATGRDVTPEMTAFVAAFLDGLPPVDGFVLKGGSPTSGPRGVRVYPSAEKSAPVARAPGFFAREVLARYPDLPVEDELRLGNPRIRDAFLGAVFTLAAFREVERGGDLEALARFQAANKLYLQACHQQLAREMGRLVASRASAEPAALLGQYRRMLAEALARPPRYTANVNVLQHALGHFRDLVSPAERAYCLELIERYREGRATLAEPRALLRAWTIRFAEPSLLHQTFFAPYPPALVVLPPDETGRGRDLWTGRGDGPPPQDARRTRSR